MKYNYLSRSGGQVQLDYSDALFVQTSHASVIQGLVCVSRALSMCCQGSFDIFVVLFL